MIPMSIAVVLIAWGATLEFGTTSAIAAAAAAIDHDFGREWPYVMMAAGAVLAAGTIRRQKCRWIYSMALVLSIMVWAAMSALMLDRGWYWAFTTVTPPLMAGLSLMLKVADMRGQRWENTSLN